MKTHTQTFKDNLIKLGKEIDVKITYTIDSVETELDGDTISSVSPHYEGNILKSVMKQVDIKSSVDIPIGTLINVQFGMKFDNEPYEYIDYGNYIVNKSDFQEDTKLYLLTCYDKMLYSMKDYEDLELTYPITIRNYINAICTELGITFANVSDTFANYDKEIESDVYLNQDYTYRDVLDELAQVTASTICINDDDELEIRYINNTNDTINEDYIKNVRASFGEKYGPINSIVLSRSAESDNVYLRDEESVTQNGLCEIKIKDNQIMNDNTRDRFLPDILEQLDGLEYYINDFESIGITYLDLCDKYNITIGNNTYSCIMFNDDVEIYDGLNENIYTKMPDQSVTDYKKADKTDRRINQTYLIVDKQNQVIEAFIGEAETDFAQLKIDVDKISSDVQSTNVELDELGNEIEVVRNSITEQTSSAITDWFDSNLKSQLEDLQNTTESNNESLNSIKSYVRRGIITDPQSPYYNQAYVEIGDETNQTTLRILPNRIQFLTNGQETAFISNNQLYINESTILTKEKVGHWVTTEDENGLLNTYWED